MASDDETVLDDTGREDMVTGVLRGLECPDGLEFGVGESLEVVILKDLKIRRDSTLVFLYLISLS